MRTTQWVGIALVALTALAQGAETRTWTSHSGQTVEAEFAGVEMDTVLLKQADGVVLRIDISRLSSNDQVLARKLAAAKRTGVAAPAATAGQASVPSHIDDLFGSKLIDAERDSQPLSSLTGKTLGVYFSAHWCPPCRAFTPRLVEAYKEIKESGGAFEIVFVSADRSKKDMADYMEGAEMPWLALPFGSKAGEKLGRLFGIRGYPTLVVLNDKGEVLTRDGYPAVMRQGAKAITGWLPPARDSEAAP